MCPVRVGYKRDSLTLVEGWKRGSSHLGVWVCVSVCVCTFLLICSLHWHGVAVVPEISLLSWIFCQCLRLLDQWCVFSSMIKGSGSFFLVRSKATRTWHGFQSILVEFKPAHALPTWLQVQLVLIGFYLTHYLPLLTSCLGTSDFSIRCRDSHVKAA